jgi:hypothetical protein
MEKGRQIQDCLRNWKTMTIRICSTTEKLESEIHLNQLHNSYATVNRGPPCFIYSYSKAILNQHPKIQVSCFSTFNKIRRNTFAEHYSAEKILKILF